MDPEDIFHNKYFYIAVVVLVVLLFIIYFRNNKENFISDVSKNIYSDISDNIALTLFFSNDISPDWLEFKKYISSHKTKNNKIITINEVGSRTLPNITRNQLIKSGALPSVIRYPDNLVTLGENNIKDLLAKTIKNYYE